MCVTSMMINITIDKKAEEDVSINIFINVFFSFSDESLKWETIEQYFLWQLITAHNIPIEHMLPVLPMLEFSGNQCFFLVSPVSVPVCVHVGPGRVGGCGAYYSIGLLNESLYAFFFSCGCGRRGGIWTTL